MGEQAVLSSCYTAEVHRVFKCGENCDPVRHLVTESMNRIAVGIVVLGPSGQVLEMNRQAREIVARGDVFVLDKDHLVALHSMNAALLSDTITRVSGIGGRSGSFIAISRPGRRTPLHVFVAPLKLDGERRVGGVALYISEPENTIHANEQLLTVLFGLSAAEARVAAGIVEGLAVPALAERLHVSVHTVRTQLKSVFAKTGAQRQSDLVRLLTSGLALVAGER